MKPKANPYRASLLQAIKVAGGPTALARKLTKECHRRIRQSHITTWRDRSKRGVPPEYCIPMEAVTGVPKEKLRPDVYQATTQ